MLLKRGLRRESCDFCFRRKMKCDRSTRLRHGHIACSPCERRRNPCRLQDPGDTTLQRGQQAPNSSPAARDVSRLLQLSTADRPCRGQQLEGRAVAPDKRVQDVRRPPLAMDGSNEQVTHEPEDTDIFSYDQPDMFALDQENLLFLDQIFMSHDWPSDGDDSLPMPTNERLTPDIADTHVDNISAETIEGSTAYIASTGIALSSLPHCSIDAGTLNAAMQAYFQFAALTFPLVSPDAFWTDLRSGACSPCLAAAIACRGIPFTNLPDKWVIQQQLARSFRQSFLEARARSSPVATLRLDELEALALMAEIEYDSSENEVFQRDLANLYLTHESLVLMMLRFDNSGPSLTPHSKALSKAAERKLCLSWFVYAVDAFKCLDQKHVSHFPDLDVLDTKPIFEHENRTYFDAVLTLAVIAHKITQTLCSVKARKHGIHPNDIRSLYGQIDFWRSTTCPTHLRRPDVDELACRKSYSGAARVPDLVRLRRAALWALEVNCIMSIEAHVSTFRLQSAKSLVDEGTALEIECRSVRAVSDLHDLIEWTREHDLEARQSEPPRFTTADLAPSILRNVAIGCCYWICERGLRLSADDRTFSGAVYMKKTPDISSKYQEVAQILKDYAASAVSHHDTMPTLERLEPWAG